MDLIILIVLIGIVVFFFKSFDSFIYCLVISDIFLRIITFIIDRFGSRLGEIAVFLRNTLPRDIPSMIDQYSFGVFNTVLIIGYIIVYILFEFYTIKYFIKMRK